MICQASVQPVNRAIHIGRGSIKLENWHGSLHLSDFSFTYPLKLVAPKSNKQCQSVFILSYGGGLVGGDEIHLSVDLNPDTVIALLTQGSTKVFKKRQGLPATKQVLNVDIGQNATCLLIPDPVQPFADATYKQDQQFFLRQNSNLILLDWIVSGRPANGEIWDFEAFTSSNTIYSVHQSSDLLTKSHQRLLLRDCQIMTLPQTRIQMGYFNCLATLMFTGPQTTSASQVIMNKFRDLERIGMHRDRKCSKSRALIWTVTRHREVTIVKAAAQTSEEVKEFLDRLVDLVSWRDSFGRDAFRALE